MNSPTEPVGPANRATMTTWLLWIAVSAATAVMGGVLQIIFKRQFGRHFDAQLTLLLFGALFLAAAPAVLQWAVLRRLVSHPLFAAWVGVSWINSVVAGVLWSALLRRGLDADRAFDVARFLAARGEGGLKLMLYVSVVTLLYNLVPIFVLGRLAQRPSRALLLSTVAGACAAVLLHKLYTGFTALDVTSLFVPFDTTRAQLSWTALAPALATLAVFGMAQGAISGFGLMRMFAPASGRHAGTAALRVCGLVAVVLIAAHGLRVAMGPAGYQAGFPDVRRALSSAPASDRSTGTPILSLSRRIALPQPVRFAVLSPDGQTVLFLTSERPTEHQAVIRLDAETGIFAPSPLTVGGSTRSLVFSPDGRYVAINQAGHSRGAGDYDFGRIRLFATHDFAKIADVWAAEQDCAFSRQMAFTHDNGGLWVLCESSRARPQDLFAVKLALPDLRIVERRPAPVRTGPPDFTSGSVIVASGAGVFAAGYAWESPSEFLSVTDITTTSRPLLASLDMWKAVPGGPGTGLCGLHLSPDAALVTVSHCAPAIRYKGDGSPAKGQFRTFATRTGDLLADFGRQEPGRDPVSWSAAFGSKHGRFAGIGTTRASKTGALVLWEQATGRELQHIETAAYRSGAFSGDGSRLLLIGRDDDAIYVYRANP
jgi:hypothetical protein